MEIRNFVKICQSFVSSDGSTFPIPFQPHEVKYWLMDVLSKVEPNLTREEISGIGEGILSNMDKDEDFLNCNVVVVPEKKCGQISLTVFDDESQGVCGEVFTYQFSYAELLADKVTI